MSEKLHIFDQYVLGEKLPHLWCPGCGNGIIENALIRAIDQTGIPQSDFILIAGIGCSSRGNGYLNFCGAQTNHGRAMAYATGIKMANPRLKLIIITGDGDCTSIGGNHFIHAARRNIDMTVILFNNNNYGMTGGQYSPTTPSGSKTKTSIYGNIEPVFNISELAITAGATYVARNTTYHVQMMIEQMKKGILHPGFSLVECICACPTLYGRFNKLGDAVEMMETQKNSAIPVAQARTKSPEELQGKIVIGELLNLDRPEYTAMYDEVIAKAGGTHNG